MNKSENDMNKKPKIMFSNFKNNWKIFSFYNLANVFQSGGTPSTKEPSFWGGTIPWIQSSDIQKDVLFGVKPQKFISEEGLQNSSAKLITKNSIAIVTRVGVGKLAIIDQDYATSQDFLSLSDFNGDTQFIVYSIYRILQKESTQLQGTSIKGITKENLLSKKISLPEIEEQSAIGSLFRTLDDLLTSYKDNLTNYQSFKATMLSKMFPKAGQTVPEIRLDGFERKWEKKKLIDLVSPVSRKVKKPSEPYYRLSIRSHAKGTFKQFVDDPKKIAMDNLFEVKENDLVVNITFAWEHAIAVASKEDDGLLVSHRFPTYVIDKSDKNFINIYIKREEFRQKMDLLSPGGAGRNRVLNVKDFINIQMIVPELEEQQSIGTYFSNLDNLIASHQEKISQLETLKKKLLQDMFV